MKVGAYHANTNNRHMWNPNMKEWVKTQETINNEERLRQEEQKEEGEKRREEEEKKKALENAKLD